ncbi:hypothetical protein BDN70DRAFT_308581 [Pholiota conissans]|uniref:Uncharacterized protein n=1 Tax=Pholiota conissans TaxID=109636 RepID=A0A9P5YSE6_9AGAR|nr:hypothetical protein BDN70DRAFT_308581 [Pholiota conissans]
MSSRYRWYTPFIAQWALLLLRWYTLFVFSLLGGIFAPRSPGLPVDRCASRLVSVIANRGGQPYDTDDGEDNTGRSQELKG